MAAAGTRAKLQRLFEVTSSPDGLAVELAVRDWSRRDRDVAERLRRVDNRRIGYIRSLFGQFCADENDVEVRSMLAYTLVIGTTSSPPSTVTRPGPRYSNSRSTACSAEDRAHIA